jgi:hypothetical protein
MGAIDTVKDSLQDFLLYIEENNYVKDKDGKYYRKGASRPWEENKHITKEELIQKYLNG